MKKKINLRFGILVAIVGLATLSRVGTAGHPFNFAPIGALALFSGCYFSGRLSKFLIPLLAVWIGDLFVNFILFEKWMLVYDGFYWQYGCYVLFVLMGTVLSKRIKPLTVAGSSVAASLLFFLVTNFGVWISGTMYSHTVSGLLTCYTAAIPFFGNTFAGDLFYSAAMFGLFELARKKYTELSLQHTPVNG
jgi:hypothetical protein